MKWIDFLNSIATRGGNIFVLLFLSVLLLVVELNLLLSGIEGRPTNVVETAFNMGFGALIGILTGGLSRQRTTDNGKDAKP